MYKQKKKDLIFRFMNEKKKIKLSPLSAGDGASYHYNEASSSPHYLASMCIQFVTLTLGERDFVIKLFHKNICTILFDGPFCLLEYLFFHWPMETPHSFCFLHYFKSLKSHDLLIIVAILLISII